MRTFASRLTTIGLSLALVALGTACQGEEGADETAPADTTAAAPTGDEAGTAGIEPGGVSSTYRVAINNPMPHAMVVKVEYTGGGETELGTVPAGSEQAFTVAASGGETVTLVATDEAGTHSPSTTLTLPAGQSETSWTID
jgi:hypothetical protein